MRSRLGSSDNDTAGFILVSADDFSTRPVTARLARPWGSTYASASWRPQGATPGRLGSPPEKPLPSETASASTFQPGLGTIRELAADGALAAVIVDLKYGCRGVETWQPATRRIVRLDRTCNPGGSVYEPSHGLALAGRRVAWLEVSGGNSTQSDVMTTALGGATPAYLAEGNANSDSETGTWASTPIGHGTLLAFTIEDRCMLGPPNPDDSDLCPPDRKTAVITTVWRLGGREACGPPASAPPRHGCTRVAHADSKLTLLAVDAVRIVLQTAEGVRLLTAGGKVLRDFPVDASAAALSGKLLALQTANAVEVYDTNSGRLTKRLPVSKAVRLEDLEGDLLVTASGETVTLRRLADGRTTSVRTVGTPRAQLEPPGLFVAGARSVTFIPIREVRHRLGS